MKKFVAILTLFCLWLIANNLNAQFSISPEVSIGVGKHDWLGLSSGVVGFEKVCWAHSYSIGLGVDYRIKNSGYSVNSGLDFLHQPAIFILASSYVLFFYQQQDIRYDTFRQKENYYFLQVPLTFERHFDSGFNFGCGVNLKYFLSGLSNPAPIFYNWDYRDFNLGAIIVLGFETKNNLSLSLKTAFEYPGFITEEFVGETTYFYNINAMLGIGYSFGLMRNDKSLTH